jgi:hypothetical protein
MMMAASRHDMGQKIDPQPTLLDNLIEDCKVDIVCWEVLLVLVILILGGAVKLVGKKIFLFFWCVK